jgi:prepilin-type N-terminal cleavage/methylation domain-containing protein
MTPRGRRPITHGFTLIEVTLALVVFLMMTLMFAAVFPIVVRGAKMSDNYTQATFLAQHKLDQLRAGGFNRLSSPGTPIVDQTQPSGYPVTGSDSSVTYSFTTADSLLNYFPTGSTGFVKITPDVAAPGGGNEAMFITITISWTGGGASNGSYVSSLTRL